MKNKFVIYLAAAAIVFSGLSLFAAMDKYDVSRAEALFINNCSKCHRKDGRGIKRVYPPLRESDYIKNGNTSELLRGMIYGRSGKLVVNGITYNGVMITEIDKSVSDEDAALILTYVYKNLNNIDKTASAKDVKDARKAGKLPEKK